MDAADRLLVLAEHEQRLVAEQRFEELAPLHEERERLLAALPATLEPRQRPLVARAHAMLQDAAARAAVARDEVAAELARLDRGRATVRGYTPAGLAAGPTVDHRG
jgi:hypothetical protein